MDDFVPFILFNCSLVKKPRKKKQIYLLTPHTSLEGSLQSKWSIRKTSLKYIPFAEQSYLVPTDRASQSWRDKGFAIIPASRK
jgi:hypothetical protein